MEYHKYFTRKNRDDFTEFYLMIDGTPQHLRDFVQEVHFTGNFDKCLPNDWIYGQIHSAFSNLPDDKRDIEDIISELECDPYYSDLQDWLKEPYASCFIEEANDEGLCTKDIHNQIGWGQMLAMGQIYRAVHEFLEENKT